MIQNKNKTLGGVLKMNIPKIPKILHKNKKPLLPYGVSFTIIGYENKGNSFKCYKEGGFNYSNEVIYLPIDYTKIERLEGGESDIIVTIPLWLKKELKTYPCSENDINRIKEVL